MAPCPTVVAAVVALACSWWASPVLACCANGCNLHGKCGFASAGCTCTCYDQWTGADCSERVCPSEKAWVGFADSGGLMHNEKAECSNTGRCDRSSGTCECQPGFEGRACERLSCPNKCSQHGSCLTLRQAAETYDGLSFFRQTTYSEWDADRIMGCKCDDGYTGYDCSERTCTTGDDPVTTGQADEVQKITCECQGTCSGLFYVSFGHKKSGPIPHSATAQYVKAVLEEMSNIRGVTVVFDSGSTVCGSPAVVTTVTFTHNAGDVPNSIASSSLLSDSGTAPVLDVLHSGESSTVIGTKENYPCNGRGVCDSSSGLCGCYVNFGSSSGTNLGSGTGVEGEVGDCGYFTTVDRCPGTTSCSGHGMCSGDGNFVCTCHTGWTGQDCSRRTCPYGKAWFAEPGHSLSGYVSVTNGQAGITTTDDLTLEINRGDSIFIAGVEYTISTLDSDTFSATTLTLTAVYSGSTDTYLEAYKNPRDAHYPVECSNRGTCSRSLGSCSCLDGFTGSACDRIKCPSDCTGRGTCEPLWRLAELTVENGDTTAYTYGQEIGNLQTWDHDMLYGCNCDKAVMRGGLYDFTGHDCSLRTCPTGDDPSSEGGVHEQQTITCTGTSGSFTVTFRQQTTGQIAYNAGVADVEAALEALDAFGDVSVSFSTGIEACSSSGEVITVTFMSRLGDLPAMSTTLTSVTSAPVDELLKGTREDAECSNHGICDRALGFCKCFPGYTASNGAGSAGTRSDCGFRDATYPGLLGEA